MSMKEEQEGPKVPRELIEKLINMIENSFFAWQESWTVIHILEAIGREWPKIKERTVP